MDRPRNLVLAKGSGNVTRLERRGSARRDGPSRAVLQDHHPFAIPGYRHYADVREVTFLDQDGKMIVRRISDQGFRKLLREMLSHHLKAELR